jgi:hypothetical protein
MYTVCSQAQVPFLFSSGIMLAVVNGTISDHPDRSYVSVITRIRCNGRFSRTGVRGLTPRGVLTVE